MNIIYRPQEIERPLFAAIGMFDGVHLGHRSLIDIVREKSHTIGSSSAVITFREHPREILHPETHIPLLSTFDERMRLLESAGLDNAIVFDFTPEIASLSAHDFLALLAEKYALKGLVIGYDHRFGHNRSDGINEYKAYGQEFGIEVIQASPFLIEGYTVSSSAIREALMQREVAKANLMLGYRFPLSGCVVDGQHIGRSLGFPTANIQFAGHNKLLPPVGVYAVTATLPDGTRYNGMMNIGYRSTIEGDHRLSVEAHLFDFSGNLYGQEITIALVDYIRDERKYDSLDELRTHLVHDAHEARRILAQENANL